MSETSQRKQIRFRKDINGLRAYAVMAVLFYHYDIYAFTGGFVGVDVFFVISGFLMTAIILRKIESGTFSLADFYLARGRRILPALAVLCLSLLVFGWFWLAPHHYEVVGKHSGASILFFSNMIYDRAGGYFATPANENWLLHTWSLSVEWQFYMTYPLLLVAIYKISLNSRKNLIFVLVLVFLASLIYSIYKTDTDPVSSFFILPTRIWELTAGGLVYLYSDRFVLDRKAEYLGLILVVSSILVFNDSTAWPGYLAVIPVAGTCLVILSSKQDSIWTSNTSAQAIGKWSYSIYLWHWPLVVGLRYFGVFDDMQWVSSAIAGAILLGAISYYAVEQTGARLMRLPGRKAWISFAITMAIPFLVASIPYFGNGVPQSYRLPESVLVAAHEKNNMGKLTKCNKSMPKCIIGEGNIQAIVWGDSHAISTVSAVVESAGKAGGSVLFFGQQACPVIFGAISTNENDRYYCRDFNDMVFSELQALDRTIPVIIINRAGFYIKPGERQMHFGNNQALSDSERKDKYLKRMTDSLCRIADNRPVFVVLPTPIMPADVPEAMSRGLLFNGVTPGFSTPLSSHEKSSLHIIEAVRQAEMTCDVRLLDPIPYLCDRDECRGDIDGRPLYADNNHLSEFGNRLLVPMFQQVFHSNQLKPL